LPLPSLLDHSTSVASSCKRIQRAEREREAERGREKDRGARVARQSAIRCTTIHSLNDISFTFSSLCRQSVCGCSLTQALLPVPTGSSSCRNSSYHSRVARWMGGWGEWRDGRAVEGTWPAVHLTPPEHTHARTHSHTSPHTTLLMMQTHTRARALPRSPSHVPHSRGQTALQQRPCLSSWPSHRPAPPSRPNTDPQATYTGLVACKKRLGKLTQHCVHPIENYRFWWFLGSWLTSTLQAWLGCSPLLHPCRLCHGPPTSLCFEKLFWPAVTRDF
jgi:hypothetical protein